MLIGRVITPSFASDSLNWPTFDQIFGQVIDAYNETGSNDGARGALRVLISNNFNLPSTVIGRLIAASTITASDAWEGNIRFRDEELAVAREIHRKCRDSLRALGRDFSYLVRISLIELRRRPREGMSLDRLSILLRTLIDGAIDRMLLDPGVFSIAEIATSTIDFRYALTEEGVSDEVLERFDLPDQFPLFEVILAAERSWASPGVDDNLTTFAASCHIPRDEIVAIFPCDRALANATVKCVVTGGRIEGDRGTRPAMFSTALRRLAKSADSTPAMIDEALRFDGDDGAFAELHRAALTLAEETLDVTIDPVRLADQLVAGATRGMKSWEATSFLLEHLRDRKGGDAPTSPLT